jgi:hypothetical protein
VKNISLAEKLCANFCRYYKPSKNEELACIGFLIIERMLKEGIEIPFDKRDRIPRPATEGRLVQNVCVPCPFYESDCDFVKERGGSLPCGGFVLLGHLLEEGIITVDNIKDMR